MAHCHSHRPRLRRRRQLDTGDLVLLPLDERRRELDRQAKRQRRIERRQLQVAQGPREVVAQLPGPYVGPEIGPASPPGWGRDGWRRRRAAQRAWERAEAARQS